MPSVEFRSHYVLAANYQVVRYWARRYGIRLASLVYIREPSDVEGVRDFPLIVFPYDGSHAQIDLRNFVFNRTEEVYDVRHFYPVSELGAIKRWVKFEAPKMGE